MFHSSLETRKSRITLYENEFLSYFLLECTLTSISLHLILLECKFVQLNVVSQEHKLNMYIQIGRMCFKTLQSSRN